MVTFQCPQCKSTFELEDKLIGRKVECANCGTQFTANNVSQVPAILDSPREADTFHPIDEAIRCPSCGTELRRGASFCWSCGAKLNELTGVGTVYQLSGKLASTRLIIVILRFIIGILLGIPVVYLLTCIDVFLFFFYILIRFPCGFIGFPCGYLSHCIFKFTLIRNKGWGLGIAFIMACFLLYFLSIASPWMDLLSEKDPFAILFWLTEAGLLVAFNFMVAARLNASLFREKFFCEKCHSWTKKSFTSRALCPIVDLTLIQQDLRDGRTDALLALSRTNPYWHHATLFVQSCLCGDLNLLSIDDVTVTKKKDKRPVESSTRLLSNVIISDKMAHSLFVRFASSSALPTALGDAPLAGPWSRWAARFVDIYLVSIIGGFLVIIDGKLLGILAIFFMLLGFMFDSAVYAIFKNTLGKWLFDIHILEASGEPISGKRYFYRNWRVFWDGFGLCIPLCWFFTFPEQYSLVSKKQPTTYDKTMNLKSVRCNPKPFKMLVGILLFNLLIIILCCVSE